MSTPDPLDTPDARLGMAWWNALPEYSRAAWLKEAHSAVPADAWEAYKRSSNQPPSQLSGNAAHGN